MLPLITPVGRGFTVTDALPVRSAAIDVQFASDNVAMLYVVFVDGLTLTEIGLLLPLNA